CERRYPDELTSRSLGLRNLRFAIKNPEMILLLGTFYFLLFVGVPLDSLGLSDVANYPFNFPLSSSLMLILLVSLCRFADCESAARRWLLGFIHTVSHTGVAIGSWELALKLVAWLGPTSGQIDWSHWLQMMGVVLGGGLAGATLFGLYLYTSLN